MRHGSKSILNVEPHGHATRFNGWTDSSSDMVDHVRRISQMDDDDRLYIIFA